MAKKATVKAATTPAATKKLTLAGASPVKPVVEPTPKPTRLQGMEDLKTRVKLNSAYQLGALMMRPGRGYLVNDAVLEELKKAGKVLSSEPV